MTERSFEYAPVLKTELEKPSLKKQQRILAFLLAEIDEELRDGGVGEAAMDAYLKDGKLKLMGTMVFSVCRSIEIIDDKGVEKLGIIINRRVNKPKGITLVEAVLVATSCDGAVTIEEAFQGKHVEIVRATSGRLVERITSDILPLPDLNYDLTRIGDEGTLPVPFDLNY